MSAVKTIHFKNVRDSGIKIKCDLNKRSALITDDDETLKGKTMFASLHTSTLTVRRVQTRGFFDGLFANLRLAYHAHTQRQKLATLDDHALADIGLSRAEARSEANRPLWDVPAAWRC